MPLHKIEHDDSEKTIQKKVEENLRNLTKDLIWNITYSYDSDNTGYLQNDGTDQKRWFTKEELAAPVMYGKNTVLIGGGWDKEKYGDVGAKIRYISIGAEGKINKFVTLLKRMDKAYRRPATHAEIDDLKHRYFKPNQFKKNFPDLSAITFADWLSPHTYFEGPMYRSKEGGEYQDMWVYGYGS